MADYKFIDVEWLQKSIKELKEIRKQERDIVKAAAANGAVKALQEVLSNVRSKKDIF